MRHEIEGRVARIESDVEHIKINTADLRVEQRRTNDKIDAQGANLDAKIDALNNKFDTKFDSLKDKLHSATVWALPLYFALAGSLLTVLAKGFKWI